MSNRTLTDYDFREDGMFFNGKRAGTLDSEGYRTVWADGKRHKEHRLIWIHYNGLIPDGYEIHHKNSVRDSNELSNLACVTLSEHLQFDQRNANPSPERNAKISDARRGTHLSSATRVKISKAQMGRRCGAGPRAFQTPSKRWWAVLGYLKHMFRLGTYSIESEAQNILNEARAFADTGPTLAEFAEWTKARNITKKR